MGDRRRVFRHDRRCRGLLRRAHAFTATSDGGTLEILYDFSGLVSGFQFDVSGLDLIGGSGGAAGDAGLQVQAGPLETVIGFDLSGSSIAAGSGVLTVLSFSDVTADLTVLSLGNGGAVSSPSGQVFATTASGEVDHSNDLDCAGDYYGDAAADDCGVCNGGNADKDCNGDCFGVALEDDCGVCSCLLYTSPSPRDS